jgi:hypothetical protein
MNYGKNKGTLLASFSLANLYKVFKVRTKSGYFVTIVIKAAYTGVDDAVLTGIIYEAWQVFNVPSFFRKPQL